MFARHLVSFILDLFRSKAALQGEILRLPHENAVLRRRAPRRPKLTNADRLFLVWPYRLWPSLAKLSYLAKPATIVRWHRAGHRAYWRWRSRRKSGRPKTERELIALIRRMARENPTWGAPRIHGELLKLGFSIAESIVAKYMPLRMHDGSGQTWRRFLQNEIAATDLMTVPTAAFGQLYALVVLSLSRRRIAFLTLPS